MPSDKINSEIHIVGFGKVVPEGMTATSLQSRETKIDLTTIVKDRKAVKFFSKQDSLTLAACHHAWEMAGIKDPNYSDRTGIYLCVGILPFEDKPLQKIAELSQTDGLLDMKRSSVESFNAMNPLITFKCLPNMPLFHVSQHLQINGRYFMTYPGIPEWFGALEKAIFDLESGLVDYAIVGAAADQNNFLVQHHVQRIRPDLMQKLVDVSGAIVLSNKPNLKSLGKIKKVDVGYQAFNPLIEKKYLIQSAGAFPAHAGVVEPSLSLIFALEGCQVSFGTQRDTEVAAVSPKRYLAPFEYVWQATKNSDCKNYCRLTVELA